MNVLALTSYPNEAAATRYRVMQFIRPLADRGINVTVRPFLDSGVFERLYRRNSWARTSVGLLKSTAARLADLGFARKTDVVFVQREAMLFGPPVFEWMLVRALKLPMVLDLDDATYVSYTSPTFGGVGSALKWFSKTDDLIRWATVVTCGNRSIAEYVASKGSRARIIPTVVDSSIFQPAPPRPLGDQVVLGWIGTHSTFPYLESIFPVLQELAKAYSFRLKIVGAGKADVNIPGVEVENLPWKLEREVADFQSIDIGLYPIDAAMYSGQWASGKSGFKAVQYMSVGIPYVATPVGASTEIGTPGVTHLFADNHEEWRQALAQLISDSRRRRAMGAAGRQHAIENYGLSQHADNLAAALREAAGRSIGE
jgi:glycosyltransferase involved in cell wall biosynthesis